MNSKRGARVIVETVAAIALTPLLYWKVFGVAYSSGERVGFVEAPSPQVAACGEHEMTLDMASAPGASGTRWTFAVRDSSLYEQLTTLGGQRVSIHYRQVKGGPSKCATDTEYTATALRTMN
jgi:hypothetical protein